MKVQLLVKTSTKDTSNERTLSFFIKGRLKISSICVFVITTNKKQSTYRLHNDLERIDIPT